MMNVFIINFFVWSQDFWPGSINVKVIPALVNFSTEEIENLSRYLGNILLNSSFEIGGVVPFLIDFPRCGKEFESDGVSQ